LLPCLGSAEPTVAVFDTNEREERAIEKIKDPESETCRVMAGGNQDDSQGSESNSHHHVEPAEHGH
jgi:hypothetical protein